MMKRGKFGMNKRGQDAGPNWFFIGLIIAVIVLIIMFAGPLSGIWSGFAQIFGYSSPANVDQLKQTCAQNCNVATYDYCCLVKEIKTAKDAPIIYSTCNKNDLIKASCNVDCSSQCSNVVCDANKIMLKTQCLAANIDTTRTLQPSLDPIKALTGDYVCCKVASLATGGNTEGTSTDIPIGSVSASQICADNLVNNVGFTCPNGPDALKSYMNKPGLMGGYVLSLSANNKICCKA